MASESNKMASRSTTGKAKGTHVFEIDGCSFRKAMSLDSFVQSTTFTVGGYDWAIRFHPSGICENSTGTGLVCLVLLLLTKNTDEVSAFYDLRLVNQNTCLPVSVGRSSRSKMAKFNQFLPIDLDVIDLLRELETSDYIKDGCLTIECTLTVVVKESQMSEIKVPPSDLSDHFGKLLLEEEGADVTFSVGGEDFAAHRIVLATRSPVFKAELYGQMKERKACRVTIEDMQPAIFRALLHFIYTDSLPADINDLDDDDCREMLWHLLVAADRYAMDRLKLICQSILSEHHLSEETVATTLALADQHNCHRLKDACVEFIASSDVLDAVMATKGYANLKRSCPFVVIDVLEKASRFRGA